MENVIVLKLLCKKSRNYHTNAVIIEHLTILDKSVFKRNIQRYCQAEKYFWIYFGSVNLFFMKVQKPRAWKWSEWKWSNGNSRDRGVNIFIDGNYFASFIYLSIGNEKSYIKFQVAERDNYSLYVSYKIAMVLYYY